MLTRDEQSTIFGGAATILGINEMLNAQVRMAASTRRRNSAQFRAIR